MSDEVRVTDPNTGGEKGSKLPQLGAIDPSAIMEVAKVAGFGAQKYERYNFLRGYRWSLSYDALQRHLHQFWSGEDRDEESGLYHLAHAAWHCLALLAFRLRGAGTDDRPRQQFVESGGRDATVPALKQWYESTTEEQLAKVRAVTPDSGPPYYTTRNPQNDIAFGGVVIPTFTGD